MVEFSDGRLRPENVSCRCAYDLSREADLRNTGRQKGEKVEEF